MKTWNLSEYFTAPVPILVRPDNFNKSLLMVFILRDANGIIYAKGYVTPAGNLKVTSSTTTGGTKLNLDTFVFTSAFEYDATMELQITAVDRTPYTSLNLSGLFDPTSTVDDLPRYSDELLFVLMVRTL
jgi:hypothetical protein